MGQGAMGIGMLGQRQAKTRWANDPVWLHGRSRQDIGQWRVRAFPPDVNQAEGREGRRRAEKGGEGRRRVDRVKKSGVSYVTINDRS